MKAFRPAVLLFVVIAAFGACGGDGGGEVAAFCDKQEEIDSIDTSDATAMSEAIREVLAEAPDEISEDVETLADALEKIEESPEDAAEIATTEVQEASQRIEKWVEDNCEEG